MPEPRYRPAVQPGTGPPTPFQHDVSRDGTRARRRRQKTPARTGFADVTYHVIGQCCECRTGGGRKWAPFQACSFTALSKSLFTWLTDMILSVSALEHAIAARAFCCEQLLCARLREIIGECCIDVDSPQERFKLTIRSRAGGYNAWFERDRGQVRSSLQNLEAWAGVIFLGAPTPSKITFLKEMSLLDSTSQLRFPPSSCCLQCIDSDVLFADALLTSSPFRRTGRARPSSWSAR